MFDVVKRMDEMYSFDIDNYFRSQMVQSATFFDNVAPPGQEPAEVNRRKRNGSRFPERRRAVQDVLLFTCYDLQRTKSSKTFSAMTSEERFSCISAESTHKRALLDGGNVRSITGANRS
jgi:hypothetical protein